MKAIKLILFVCAALAFTVAVAFAQTNAPPVIPPGLGFPDGKDAGWLLLVPPATATIAWALGKIPALPKPLLPWITPLAGIGIGALLNYAAKANLPWWSTAGAGAIATTLYEGIKGLTRAGPESILTPTTKTSS